MNQHEGFILVQGFFPWLKLHYSGLEVRQQCVEEAVDRKYTGRDSGLGMIIKDETLVTYFLKIVPTL